MLGILTRKYVFNGLTLIVCSIGANTENDVKKTTTPLQGGFSLTYSKGKYSVEKCKVENKISYMVREAHTTSYFKDDIVSEVTYYDVITKVNQKKAYKDIKELYLQQECKKYEKLDLDKISFSEGEFNPMVFKTRDQVEFYSCKYFFVVKQSDEQGKNKRFTYQISPTASRDLAFPCCGKIAHMLLQKKYKEQLKIEDKNYSKF